MRAPREKTLTVSWRKKDKAHIFFCYTRRFALVHHQWVYWKEYIL